LRKTSVKSAAVIGTTLRVLLVEDSQNDAMLLLRELRRSGYQPLWQRVYTREDMEKALRAADARGEPFQVVISDYYMPRFRAPVVLEWIELYPECKPFSTFCIGGERRAMEDVQLSDLLAVCARVL